MTTFHEYELLVGQTSTATTPSFLVTICGATAATLEEIKSVRSSNQDTLAHTIAKSGSMAEISKISELWPVCLTLTNNNDNTPLEIALANSNDAVSLHIIHLLNSSDLCLKKKYLNYLARVQYLY